MHCAPVLSIRPVGKVLVTVLGPGALEEVVAHHQIKVVVGGGVTRSREKASGEDTSHTCTELQIAVVPVRTLHIVLFSDVSAGLPFQVSGHHTGGRIVQRIGGGCQPVIVPGGGQDPVAPEPHASTESNGFEI